MIRRTTGDIFDCGAENLEATPIDISNNPHDYEFREIEAAQLPRVLPDVDLAFINNTFAQPAGLSLDDALIKEGPDSPYVNLIVVRGGDQDQYIPVVSSGQRLRAEDLEPAFRESIQTP